MTTYRDMNGKVCIVTGATNGIGRVTAQALARMGATVVVVGRSEGRAKATASEIRGETGNKHVDYLLADYASFGAVRAMAEAFRGRYDRLDVLVNNAGALFMKRELTADGYEMTMQVNHLSHFLLTNLLQDMMTASGPARIINVSSGAHMGGRIDFESWRGERGPAGFGMYAQSKLANILFTTELARRLDGTEVTTNALHPGFVGTGFAKNNNLLIKLGMTLLQPFILTPQQGAQTSVYLATSPEVEQVNGRYFVDSRPAQPSAAARDDAMARRLWDASAEITEVGAATAALV